MTFRELINESVTPNAIEYVTRDLFKGKSLKSACKSFIKKFSGESHMLGTVDYSVDELMDAVVDDKAKEVIKTGLKYKEGMGHIALSGLSDRYNIDIDVLRAKVKELTKGENVNGVLN